VGIAGTDGASAARFGSPFASLTAEQQDAILHSMESGQARGEAWKGVSAKSFFTTVVSHTMQGFYGDPRHGGNRDRVSWKMIGLPYPPIRGRLS
jgi:gluconate 2-dehydrogenase gamma chain